MCWVVLVTLTCLTLLLSLGVGPDSDHATGTSGKKAEWRVDGDRLESDLERLIGPCARRHERGGVAEHLEVSVMVEGAVRARRDESGCLERMIDIWARESMGEA